MLRLPSGAIAVQCPPERCDLTLLAALDDRPTRLAVTAERAFLKSRRGLPPSVSAYAMLDLDMLRLAWRVSGLDGAQTITISGTAPAADSYALGARLAAEALDQGADDLLATVRGELPA